MLHKTYKLASTYITALTTRYARPFSAPSIILLAIFLSSLIYGADEIRDIGPTSLPPKPPLPLRKLWLARYLKNLDSDFKDIYTLYKAVHAKSVKGDYVLFRSSLLIPYDIYIKNKAQFLNATIFIYYIRAHSVAKRADDGKPRHKEIDLDKLRYNELGGVALRVSPLGLNGAVLQSVPWAFLRFDGRYYTDLLLGSGMDDKGRAFALCKAPYMDMCLMLGVGEEF